jgi:hypothetical protein
MEKEKKPAASWFSDVPVSFLPFLLFAFHKFFIGVAIVFVCCWALVKFINNFVP